MFLTSVDAISEKRVEMQRTDRRALDARRMSRARRHGCPRIPLLWNGDVCAAGIGDAAERFSPDRFPLFAARTGNCDTHHRNAVIDRSLFVFGVLERRGVETRIVGCFSSNPHGVCVRRRRHTQTQVGRHLV